MSAPYTIDELMCVLMAREIRDGDWVNHGAVVPLAGAALLLAKRTHAPALDYFYLGTVFHAITPDETDLGVLMRNPESAFRTSRAVVSHHDVLNFTFRGNCDFQFLRPLQIDRLGNINVSVLGDRAAPTQRFHGIATADAMVLVRRICLYVTEHSRRVFVERLPFRTGTGHAEADRWRAQIGAPGAGPVSVVTPLCVFEFPESRGYEMSVRSVHPGVAVEDVVQATGFPLHVPDDVRESAPPSDVELHMLRDQIDRAGIRKMEFKELREGIRREIYPSPRR
jgi:glutaconate CoA-transferase subunit B